MYCPKCSQQQISDNLRFCSRCGLPLGTITDLLANTEQQLKREKRTITGVVLIMTTASNLLIYLVVFGATVLPHVANWPVFLSILILFLVLSLVIGGLGVFKLAQGGFFKNLKERQLRNELALIEGRRREIEADAEGVTIKSPPRLEAEPPSVTEATTRELQSAFEKDWADARHKGSGEINERKRRTF